MKRKKLIFGSIFLLITIAGIAQGPPPPPPQPPNLPIDRGLLFLLIIAVLFGIKKLKR